MTALLRLALVMEAPTPRQRLLEEAASLASCVSARWRTGGDLPDPAPAVLLGVLPRGQRRLPTALADLADQRLTDVPVVLLADEPLVRPEVHLAGGRLTLLDGGSSASLIAERIRAAIDRGHQRDQSHDKPLSWRGRRWHAVLVGADPAAVRPIEGGLVGVIGAGEAAAAATDIAGMAAACREPFAASRLLPSLLARAGGDAVAVLVPGEAGPWSLARRGAAHIHLASHRRLPSQWSLPAGQDVRLLPCLRGDLIIAGTDLPDLPDLPRLAEGGVEAVAAHAAEQAALAGRPLKALIVEVMR